MALEAADYIKQLNATNPEVGDDRSQGDDHLRLIKKVLVQTFPNFDRAITRTAEQINKAPYNKQTVEELFGHGVGGATVKVPTVQAFAGGAAVDIAFGWNAANKRIKAYVAGSLVLDDLATMGDVATGSMPNADTLLLGAGMQIQRYVYVQTVATPYDIVFRTPFTATPFLVLVQIFNGYEGRDLHPAGDLLSRGTYSVGGTFIVDPDYKTLQGMRVTGYSSNAGKQRIAVYVVGKVE